MAPAAGGVVVTVRDHGPGVAEEHLDAMFEPFYRLADARDRVSGGTGLGLAITRRAIRLHGGTVEAANAEGGGLIVELRLPLEPPA
jgi:two-component system sensor histidine kinase CpxA